jgi:hypothetical protein
MKSVPTERHCDPQLPFVDVTDTRVDAIHSLDEVSTVADPLPGGGTRITVVSVLDHDFMALPKGDPRRTAHRPERVAMLMSRDRLARLTEQVGLSLQATAALRQF